MRVRVCVQGVITTLAVKGTDRSRKLPYVRPPAPLALLRWRPSAHAPHCIAAARQILDATSLYLNNCVLGISLFNFGAPPTRTHVVRSPFIGITPDHRSHRGCSAPPTPAGMFAYVHGIVSCGARRAVEVVALRSVLSPLCCLCVMLIFGLRGEELKIMVMQGALPQAGTTRHSTACAHGECGTRASGLTVARDAPSCSAPRSVVFCGVQGV